MELPSYFYIPSTRGNMEYGSRFPLLEGIWNAFRNALLVWEFLKSLNFGRLETVEFRPDFWNIFGNLGISVHSVFLVQVNNGYGTNSNHIRIKKPPLTPFWRTRDEFRTVWNSAR